MPSSVSKNHGKRMPPSKKARITSGSDDDADHSEDASHSNEEEEVLSSPAPHVQRTVLALPVRRNSTVLPLPQRRPSDSRASERKILPFASLAVITGKDQLAHCSVLQLCAQMPTGNLVRATCGFCPALIKPAKFLPQNTSGIPENQLYTCEGRWDDEKRKFIESHTNDKMTNQTSPMGRAFSLVGTL
jgi:hypothetical protein